MLVSSLKLLNCSYSLDNSFYKLYISTLAFYNASSLSSNYFCSSLIRSCFLSSSDLCFIRNESVTRSHLILRSRSSSLNYCSNLTTFCSNCDSLSSTLSLSRLHSSIRFLLSMTSCITDFSFSSYKLILYSWSSSS